MNEQRWLSTSFLVFFFTWGIFLPYWTGWLTSEKGLSVTDASIVMGAGMIARSISTFFVFPYLTKKLPLIRVIQWTTLSSLVIALLYLPDSSFFLLLLLTVMFSAVYPMILPGVESGASLLVQQGAIQYGRSRSYGSIGYTAALLLIGAATAIWSTQAILYVMIGGLIVGVLFYSRPSPSALQIIPQAEPVRAKKGQMKELFSQKSVLAVMALAVLLQGAHASYYNYGFIYLNDLGINGVYIGIILNIAVLFEILFFTKADRLLANVNISTMFLVAAIGSTVRWVAIFLFPVTWVFIATQVLHALSFGVAHFAFIQFISKHLPSSLIAAAQGFYAAVAMSLSTALLTFPAGYLYDQSPGLAFLSMAACSITAIFIVLRTRSKLAY